MDKKQSLLKMAEQSQEEWRKQFDPQSDTYHKGNIVPVPLNGQRIPQSMPGMYPEGFDPNQPEVVIDYGEDYRKIQQNRTIYQNLKKSLAKLCPVVESFLRHYENFKAKGDLSNEKHIQVFEDNIQKQKLTLKAVHTELEQYLPKLSNMDEEGLMIGKELSIIIQDSSKKYESKQTLTEFNFKVKKLSTQTFSTSQKCLQKLKDIKKEKAKQMKKNEADTK